MDILGVMLGGSYWYKGKWDCLIICSKEEPICCLGVVRDHFLLQQPQAPTKLQHFSPWYLAIVTYHSPLVFIFTAETGNLNPNP